MQRDPPDPDATRIAGDATRLRPSPSDDRTRLAPAPPADDGRTRVAPSPVAGEEEATRLAGRPSATATSAQGARPQLGPGSVIKQRFLLVKELGRGGMGRVYSARDLVHEAAGEREAWVAIKLLSEGFKDHPEALHMLQQETQKARQLAHPNIATVYDFDRDGELVYMTMELLTGQSLDAYLKQRQFQPSEPREVYPIISDIAQGLMYAHQRGIVHSDIKPSNIFLTETGAKLLDFGIARAVKRSDAQPEETGFIALTPGYASLEMFLGEPPDPRDDIYAFACICYQLFSGEHPYHKRTAQEALQLGLVPERIKALKERQWRALLEGLALQREQRSASVDEFVGGLLPRRREPWKLASYLLIVLSLLSGGYYFFRPTRIVAPSLFENPPAEQPLSGAQQTAVNDALEVAEVHMLVGRLLSPPGSNALDEYRKVLKLHPYDRRAIAGLREILKRLAEQARSALRAGDTERARALVREGLKIHPKEKPLLALRRELGPQTSQPKDPSHE